MKGKAKLIGLFFAGTIVGLGIGATTTYKGTAQPYQGIVADQYLTNVMSETHNAIRLRQGQQAEISRRIEMNFPNYVLMIDHEFKNHPQATKALQNIKFFYQKKVVARALLLSLPLLKCYGRFREGKCPTRFIARNVVTTGHGPLP